MSEGMRGFTGKQMLLVLGWPVVVGIAVAYFIGGPQFVRSSDVAAELSSRPPIAILNIGESVRALPAGSGEPGLQATIAKGQSDARKLRDAGYLVLDANNVYAYPKDYEVRP